MTVDSIALKKITDPAAAKLFVAAVRDSTNAIPVREQRKMAKLVQEGDIARKQIKQYFAYWGHKEKKQLKALPDVAKFMRQDISMIEKLTTHVNALNANKKYLPGVERLVFCQAANHLQRALHAFLEKDSVHLLNVK